MSLILKVTARLAVAAGAVALVSGCGGARNMIDPHGTAKYIGDVVHRQTGFRPADIRCPSGIPAKPGRQFNCHFTGPEGPYTAYLLVQKVNGRRVQYALKTQPSSWAPPTLH